LSVDAAVKMKFMAVEVSADHLGTVGIDQFSLQFRDVAVEVNQGKPWSAAAGAPMPVIDWAASFPATDGFPVVTGGDPILIDFEGDPLVGFSADKTLLRISDAVHVSGSFAFRAGPIEHVDVATGIDGTPSWNPGLAAALATIDESATDPGGTT